VARRLARQGIVVVAERAATLSEEAPEAYKEIGAVVDVMDRAGIGSLVARLCPLAVIKG
jgi:tRNA-splicing ligase RtcB